MTTLLYSHSACREHDTGAMHPERPARLDAVLETLAGDEFAGLERREAPRATVEQIARVHPKAFVEAVLEAIPDSGHVGLDADTIVSPGSGEAALRAAGALCAAVDAVIAGEADNAFCAVRPPGHHAEQARKVHGLTRVAVVDFDVHHGNGTQAMFWDDPDLFYASTHQSPLYPGTGAASERGAAGNIVNAPLPPMAGTREFRQAMEGIVLPALAGFAPELVIVSAGFDAHANDPLANLQFQDEDYAWATRELLKIAREHSQGRLVSALEGGYDLKALASSSAAHVRALMTA